MAAVSPLPQRGWMQSSEQPRLWSEARGWAGTAKTGLKTLLRPQAVALLHLPVGQSAGCKGMVTPERPGCPILINHMWHCSFPRR